MVLTPPLFSATLAPLKLGSEYAMQLTADAVELTVITVKVNEVIASNFLIMFLTPIVFFNSLNEM